MTPDAWIATAIILTAVGCCVWGVARAWGDRHDRIMAREFPDVAHWNEHPPQCPICYPGPIADSVDFAKWAKEVRGA